MNKEVEARREAADEKKAGGRRRRPKDEIAAEKKAWLLKHEWAGPKNALNLLAEARDLIEKAKAACVPKVAVEPVWDDTLDGLGVIYGKVQNAIPPEVK